MSNVQELNKKKFIAGISWLEVGDMREFSWLKMSDMRNSWLRVSNVRAFSIQKEVIAGIS
ncbi:hypothetical protein WUBG_17763 [Wuchereria bancrofti]|uniref:Uncharacterized protein n=1 Tax=Wuchereria bancrofti TaxID=6293 RepID=J9E2Z8_WUCBA|nr:hypothetical protein WUBG_17763 [Wuchereria bancrofti]